MPPKKRKAKWVDLEKFKEEQEKEESWQEQRDKSIEEEKQQPIKIKAKTKNQETYINSINKCTVTICSGVAGSGKTFIACGLAAEMLLDNKIEKIVIARPLVECGQRLEIGRAHV